MSNTSNQHAGMSEDEPSIEGNETGRIQMDKLIMNYLVTGIENKLLPNIQISFCFFLFFCRRFQRRCREVPTGIRS